MLQILYFSFNEEFLLTMKRRQQYTQKKDNPIDTSVGSYRIIGSPILSYTYWVTYTQLYILGHLYSAIHIGSPILSCTYWVTYTQLYILGHLYSAIHIEDATRVSLSTNQVNLTQLFLHGM